MKRKERSYSGTINKEVSQRELKNKEIAAKAAEEGIVLLKNLKNILPLAKESKVALFGGGACKTIKGGTGSGDVNERESVSILQGMLNYGFDITTMEWLNDYEKEYETAREDWKNNILDEVKEGKGEFFDIYSAHSFDVPSGREVTIEDLHNSDTDTAIYVISRVAGEAADRFEIKGDYYLTDRELENLEKICGYYSNIILIINTGAQIDLSFVDNYNNITGIVYIVQAGMEGGNALAKILVGEATPSGKLADTWAKEYKDYPAAETFSHNNGNVYEEYYNEGIYVGYRYFDSFEKEPRYCFGYGLSYTNFKISPLAETIQVNEDKQIIVVNMQVKNIGNRFKGKEVVQVYVSCPKGRLSKELRRLCGFAKTEVLGLGETENIAISFAPKAMASYDEKNSEWILEKGLYGIWAGSSLNDCLLVGGVLVEEDSTVEKTIPICPVNAGDKKNLKEIKCPIDRVEKFWKNLNEEIKNKALPVVPMSVRLEERAEYDATNEEEKAKTLVEKLTVDELILMTVGEIKKGQTSVNANALGSAGSIVPGSAGETSSGLKEKYDLPGVTMADGPAGLRLINNYDISKEDGSLYQIDMLDALEGGIFKNREEHANAQTYYQYCTAIPVGTILAQTWNTALMERVGMAIAEEMQEFGITWWLAPGMNIHRDPLCGRNFEYYSEDPLLSGYMAAYITKGVQSEKGTGTTIKHFACNNQEDNRKGSNSILSERVLREIYLKGFEIAVKESQPMAIMTSYNLINGIHTANSYDLCTQVARTEWGFKGIIMTDWTTTAASGGSIPHKCIKAGNDLIMPGCYNDIEDIRHALSQGELSLEELKNCVIRLIAMVYQSNNYLEVKSYGERFVRQ